jgi:hypothetical protein
MKRLNTLLAGAVLSLALTGCASNKQNMESSNIVPGAQGTVSAKSAENDNTELTIKVKHLAPAQKVSTNASNYIVWIQPEGSRNFQNVGALRVNDNLEGSQTTTIPYKRFKVLVTPELGAMAQSPTGPTIFEKQVSRQ